MWVCVYLCVEVMSRDLELQQQRQRKARYLIITSISYKRREIELFHHSMVNAWMTITLLRHGERNWWDIHVEARFHNKISIFDKNRWIWQFILSLMMSSAILACEVNFPFQSHPPHMFVLFSFLFSLLLRMRMKNNEKNWEEKNLSETHHITCDFVALHNYECYTTCVVRTRASFFPRYCCCSTHRVCVYTFSSPC